MLSVFVLACAGYTQYQQESLPAMSSVSRKIIILDAGHGGWDPGKTGTSDSQDEKNINLAVMEKLQRYLEQGGATVYITRSTDEALGESKRKDMAERKVIVDESEGDLLISIHQNAFPSASVKGAQVFYHESSPAGKQMAEVIQESLRTNVDEGNTRQAKSNKDYYILRAVEIPAVLVECGFLSNTNEEHLLNQEEYQEAIAWAIYLGVMEYYEQGDVPVQKIL